MKEFDAMEVRLPVTLPWKSAEYPLMEKRLDKDAKDMGPPLALLVAGSVPCPRLLCAMDQRRRGPQPSVGCDAFCSWLSFVT